MANAEVPVPTAKTGAFCKDAAGTRVGGSTSSSIDKGYAAPDVGLGI